MTTMTTDMLASSLLGRACAASMVPGVASMLSGGVPTHARPQASVLHATVSPTPVGAAHAYIATRTTADVTTRTNTTVVVINPWLGGFGFGTGVSNCSTIVEESTKRIHPGRPAGVT